jgi:hypothetical protein
MSEPKYLVNIRRAVEVPESQTAPISIAAAKCRMTIHLMLAYNVLWELPSTSNLAIEAVQQCVAANLK